MIEYRRTRLTHSEIYKYLSENDNDFIPPLSTRKNITDYSLKLAENSVQFCAFDNKKIIAIVACYFNNLENRSGFISTVSVMKGYQQMGICKALLADVKKYGVENNFISICLEVKCRNQNAVKIYKKAGFKEVSMKDDFIYMRLILNEIV
jgi:ribosomal protein S18 acetylase RimI-like enzyme